MRVSVDIDQSMLESVMELTGEKNKSPAIAKAVAEYVYRQKSREFGRMIREGAFDYPDAPEAGADATNPIPPLASE